MTKTNDSANLTQIKPVPKGWSHEFSYKGMSLVSLLHRKRLDFLFRLLKEIPLPASGTVADFGCSNGFVISLLQAGVLKGKAYSYFGFDCSDDLLDLARGKGLSNTEFYVYDLNALSSRWEGSFDVVLCLETLEHVGDYYNAIANLYITSKVGGFIVLSVPNEKGIPGITKYLGRRILRRNAYGDFFENQSELQYIKYLLLSKNLQAFRAEKRQMWGPHLGFDWCVLRNHLNEGYIATNRLRLISERASFLNYGHFFVLQKMM